MTRPRDLLFQGWLRRLDWSLSTLPKADRSEIVAEYQSHIEQRLEAGMDMADTLSTLGDPEMIARQFVDDFVLAQAMGSRDFAPMARVAARWFHRSVAAAAALLTISLLCVFTGGVVLTAIMRFADPIHWGLWLAPGMLLFGRVDDPSATELLGAWIYPVAIVIALISWAVGRIVLLWAINRIAGRTRKDARQ